MEGSIFALVVLTVLDSRGCVARVTDQPIGRGVPLKHEVDDITQLAHGATRGGLERDHASGRFELVGPHEFGLPPGTRVRGRSCALPLALAYLAACEGLQPVAAVYATGDLSSGRADVGRVDDLKLKVQAALAHADPTEPVRILVPACQCDELRAVLDASTFNRLTPVGSLVEAATIVFGQEFVPGLHVELRHEIERLRYDTARAPELFDKCARLWSETAAQPGGPDAWGLRQMRYHAALTATFAAGIAPDAALMSGFGLANAPKHEAALRTAEIALEIRERQPAAPLAPELVAQHFNFDATRFLREPATSSFIDGIQQIERGLALVAPSAGRFGEYRKLLGTRGQLQWRLALRLWACGLVGEAQASARAAVDSVREALELAPFEEPANDRARVLCYVAAADLVANFVGVAADAQVAEQRLQEVLGSCWRGIGKPMQDPAWALAYAFQCRGLRGQWHDMLADWQELVVDDCSEALSLLPMRERLLTASLPCFSILRPWLAKAAALSGEQDLADDLWLKFGIVVPVNPSVAAVHVARWSGYAALETARRAPYAEHSDRLANHFAAGEATEFLADRLGGLARALRRDNAVAYARAGQRLSAALGEVGPYSLDGAS